MLLHALSVVALACAGLCLAYLLLLALAAARPVAAAAPGAARTRFAVVIPAHNESLVIGRTVAQLRLQSYPPGLYDVHVIADFCDDATAAVARQAGATCWERQSGDRHGKGSALAWFFERLFAAGEHYDAIVVFDADTQVDRGFLAIVDSRLAQGCAVVQGCHRISNPRDSWFASLMWAMFIIDNRVQNQGRNALGWSAKNMGDSICYRVDIIKQLGWGSDLTEDYRFRQRLLLEGVHIAYEPRAIGYGEAPLSWAAGGTQRKRWLRGSYLSNRQYAAQMLREGLRRRDTALLDGAAQAVLPSYSSLTMIAAAGLAAHVVAGAALPAALAASWMAMLAILVVYPFWALALERAPARAYGVMLLGPVFIVWRTWLGLRARLGGPIDWVRTARRDEARKQ